MEKDLLQAVIKVESEIQQSIESEREKAVQWLESVRVSLSHELEAKRQQLDEEFKQSLATTSQKCEFQAKKEIAAVNKMAEILQNLPDEIILHFVKEYLPEILPEK
jgi:16S rRNA U516 pseudouridylate synthase RsuA-like enzyme